MERGTGVQHLEHLDVCPACRGYVLRPGVGTQRRFGNDLRCLAQRGTRDGHERNALSVPTFDLPVRAALRAGADHGDGEGDGRHRSLYLQVLRPGWRRIGASAATEVRPARGRGHRHASGTYARLDADRMSAACRCSFRAYGRIIVMSFADHAQIRQRLDARRYSFRVWSNGPSI